MRISIELPRLFGTWPVIGGLLALALNACGGDFDSQMRLSGYRVVGIEASRPEVTPDETLQVTAHDFYDGDAQVEYTWSLCLNGLGPNVAYRCSDKKLELSVGTSRTVTLELGPEGLGIRQLLAELPVITDQDGKSRNLERGFSVWLRLRSGPDCAGCKSIESVMELSLRDYESDTPNANPAIESFDIQGKLKRGGKVTLHIKTDDPEKYVERFSFKRVDEEYLYSWYASGGETTPTRTFGTDQETELLLPNEPGAIELIVAVRDGRGGFALARQVIELE